MHLVVPTFNKAEWVSAIADAADAESPLLNAQWRLASLVESLESATATPERLAWLTLWSRFFGCVEAARGAVSRASLLGLGAVRRASEESLLHIEAIMN